MKIIPRAAVMGLSISTGMTLADMVRGETFSLSHSVFYAMVAFGTSLFTYGIVKNKTNFRDRSHENQ